MEKIQNINIDKYLDMRYAHKTNANFGRFVMKLYLIKFLFNSLIVCYCHNTHHAHADCRQKRSEKLSNRFKNDIN